MRLEQLLQGLNILELHADPDTEITGVCYDSRQCAEGAAFVAISGYAADGGATFAPTQPVTAAEAAVILDRAKKTLYAVEDAIMRGDQPSSVLDLDTVCDWYLINEVLSNNEGKSPKSTFFYYKDGKLHSGPVWDFDYGTFIPEHHGLQLKSSLYYYQLWTHPEFKSHLKHRWSIIKPVFQNLGTYIDKQANLIRKAEARNHEMWPCYPNPLSETADGKVNGDEVLSFDEAVAVMKSALQDRIEEVDLEINRL